MKKLILFMIPIAVIWLSVELLACPYGGGYAKDCPMYNKWEKSRGKDWQGWNRHMSMIRHHYVMRNGIPGKYSGLKVTLRDELWRQLCCSV